MVAAGFAAVAVPAAAQAKKNRPPEIKSQPTPAATATPLPEAPSGPKSPTKRNERPGTVSNGESSYSRPAAEPAKNRSASYSYEFVQPNFPISRVVIEHDDAGKGTISFRKKGHDEMFTDPLQISAAAMERIRGLLDTLNFLESNEDYQYEKDYSHLGTVTFRLKKNGRERAVTYNYSLNKDARGLSEEYRKLSNQYIWIFDISVSRENQPFDAPQLLDGLDSYFRRNEVSDKEQMIPLLRELSNDERIPLIARNHADRLVKQLEKAKK